MAASGELAGERGDAGARAAGLGAAIAELEVQRQHALAAYRRAVAVALVLAPLALTPLGLFAWSAQELAPGVREPALRGMLRAAFQSQQYAGLALALLALPFPALGLGIVAFRRSALEPRWEYQRAYKQRVLGAVCREQFPGITYEPAAGIPRHVIEESGLLRCASDVFRSEDRFTGRQGATAVCFAEAVAQIERTRGFGKERETVTETLFRGLVFIADFNKHFSGTPRLLPRGQPGASVAGEQPVELEDPRFRALFDTRSTDQIEARYLLSPSAMERLVALTEKCPGMRARFHAERLLLLMPSARDRFEPELSRPAGDVSQLATFTHDVRECLALVDALDLDTRIWTKR